MYPFFHLNAETWTKLDWSKNLPSLRHFVSKQKLIFHWKLFQTEQNFDKTRSHSSELFDWRVSFVHIESLFIHYGAQAANLTFQSVVSSSLERKILHVTNTTQKFLENVQRACISAQKFTLTTARQTLSIRSGDLLKFQWTANYV